MKRVFRVLCLVAMVALVATSCKKNNETRSISVDVGEITGYQSNPDFDGLKSYVDPDNGAFKWNQGDKIMVYNLSNSNPKESEYAVFEATSGGSGHSQFVLADGETMGDKKDQIFVFFQEEKAGRMIKQNGGNIETFEVQPTQTYNADYKMDPKAMVMASVSDYASNTLGTFNMQHIFGFVNIGIAHNSKGDAIHVDSIVITDAHWNLTGKLDLKLPAVNPQEFSSLINELVQVGPDDANYLSHLRTYLGTVGYHAHSEEGLGRSVTLICNQDLTYKTWTNFYIALRPGALYKGFTIEIYCNGDTNPTYYKTFDGTEMTELENRQKHLIKPGHFRNFYFRTKADPTYPGGYYMEKND